MTLASWSRWDVIYNLSFWNQNLMPYFEAQILLLSPSYKWPQIYSHALHTTRKLESNTPAICTLRQQNSNYAVLTTKNSICQCTEHEWHQELPLIELYSYCSLLQSLRGCIFDKYKNSSWKMCVQELNSNKTCHSWRVFLWSRSDQSLSLCSPRWRSRSTSGRLCSYLLDTLDKYETPVGEILQGSLQEKFMTTFKKQK